MSAKARRTAQLLTYGVVVGDRFALNPDVGGPVGTVVRVWRRKAGTVIVKLRWDHRWGEHQTLKLETCRSYFYPLPKPGER